MESKSLRQSIMSDLAQDFRENGTQSVLFAYYWDKCMSDFRIVAKSARLAGNCQRLTVSLLNEALSNGSLGPLKRIDGLADIIDGLLQDKGNRTSAVNAGVKQFRGLLIEAQNAAERDVSGTLCGTLSSEALVRTYASLESHQVKGSPAVRVMSCYLDILADVLIDSSESKTFDEEMFASLLKKINVKYESFCKSAYTMGNQIKREKRSDPLFLTIEGIPLTNEARDACSQLVMTQAQQWLANTGFGSADSNGSAVKSAAIDIDLVERWNNQLVCGEAFDEQGESLNWESLEEDTAKLIEALKADSGAHPRRDILIPLSVDSKAGVGLYVMGAAWFDGLENVDKDLAQRIEQRGFITALLTTTYLDLYEAESMEKTSNLGFDAQRMISEHCDPILTRWSGNGASEPILWFQRAQRTFREQAPLYSTYNGPAPKDKSGNEVIPERFKVYFKR